MSWNVQFINPETGEVHYCEKPFITRGSAEFFVQTIELTTKYKAKIIEVKERCESCQE